MILQKIRYKDLENWSVKSILGEGIKYNQDYPLVKLKEILKRDKTQITIQNNVEYKRVTIKLYNGGIFLRDKKFGKDIGTKKQFLIKKGQFLLSKIDARNGAFGIVPDELDGAIITGNFWTYNVDYLKINPLYLTLITTTKQFIELCNSASSGTTGRHYLDEEIFLNTKIPLPDIETQRKSVQNYLYIKKRQKELQEEYPRLLEEFENKLFISNSSINNSLLQKVRYKDLENWSVKSILGEGIKYNQDYPLVKLKEILKRDKTQITIQNNVEYKRVTIKLYNGGIFLRDKKFGKDIGTKKQFLIKKGQFLLSKIDARNGAFGIVPEELDGAIITADFLAFDFTNNIYPEYLKFLVSTKSFNKLVETQSKGTTGRKRIKENEFLDIKIPLPDIDTQKKLVQKLKENLQEQKDLKVQLHNAINEFENEIFE